MRLQLITLRGVKLDEDIYELMLPTAAGEIAIFPGHEPLVGVAIPGVASVRRNKGDNDEKLEVFAITNGVLEVLDDTIRLLVDEADQGEDIIEAESKAALERAEKRKVESKDQVEIAKAEQIIMQERARLHVADIRRRRRRQ